MVGMVDYYTYSPDDLAARLRTYGVEVSDGLGVDYYLTMAAELDLKLREAVKLQRAAVDRRMIEIERDKCEEVAAMLEAWAFHVKHGFKSS